MAKFFLTRRANIDLLNIEDYSLRKWGEYQTDTYMNDLFHTFNKIANKPEIGRLRYDRSFPFYMAPTKQHFAIYQPNKEGIIIATVLHGRRNIETIVRNMAVTLAAEIRDIEAKNLNHPF
ncbi:MAG: type II toxin-antitoxin system RelE/ParE family toxin [Bacteroidetes bacterium]|nr:type II toxin-antitoxin system RelE/ParE family toxin [Bacteroidota bacterium]MDA1121940.1 type II toxin-antitoxin system RelE/ParE family toxin [Bacteroidota bacterium]